MEKALKAVKALADASRMRVVAVLADNGELCVCQIIALLHLAPATVSRHMSVLQNGGLVSSRKEGRWVYYRLSESFPPMLKKWLEKALARSSQIAGDRQEMNRIVACDRRELCRRSSGR